MNDLNDYTFSLPVMINRSAFVPIHHPTLDAYYRTPVWVEPDYYTVCIEENVHRYYTNKTAPREIKAGVAMVNAFPYVPYREGVQVLECYNWPSEKQRDVGWRVNQTMYILVLSDDTLRHMYVTGESDGRHARAQSKEESN